MNRNLIVSAGVLVLCGAAAACPSHSAPVAPVASSTSVESVIASPMSALIRIVASEAVSAPEQMARKTGPSKAKPPTKKPGKNPGSMKPGPGNMDPTMPERPRTGGPGGDR